MGFSTGNKDDKTDAELLDRARGSDGEVFFGELYTRYVPLIYGLCLKYLRNRDDAQDAVMQIYEETSGKLDKYVIREFRVWIYSVAKNHCLQKLRKKKIEFTDDFGDGNMEFADLTHLLDKRDDEVRLAALEKCMEQLPEPQKISLRLFFMEERSYTDIAEKTKYQLKSVKSFIQNGKRNLKNCVEKTLG